LLSAGAVISTSESRAARAPGRENATIVAARAGMPLPGSEKLTQKIGSALAELADDLEPMAADLEALPAQVGKQLGSQTFEQAGVIGQGQVADTAGALAAEVIVGLGPSIVTDRAAAVGQASGQAGVHQGIEGLVDRGQGDVGDVLADSGEDLLGG